MPASLLTRRALFKSGAALLALFAPPAGRVDAMPELLRKLSGNAKKPIKEFGRLYEYLKDHELREKERGTANLEIREADLTGMALTNVIWRNFTFVACQIPGTYHIRLHETTNCRFMGCTFTPGPRDSSMSFGWATNVVFQRCTFNRCNVSFGGKPVFANCKFEAEYSERDNSGSRFISSTEGLELIECTFRYYSLLADVKLHMKRCDYAAFRTGPIISTEGKADFILEDTKFQNADEIFWNNRINNLTLRGVETKGSFAAQQCSIKDTITLERLKVGSYYFGQTGTEQKITVRDCHFSEPDEMTTYVFSCSGDFARELLLERVTCTDAGACNLTGAGFKTTEKFRTPDTRNQTFTLRGCKIPRLMLHWLQSHNLVIENCEFGKLELRNARLGNVTIRNTKFETLDLTNTLATQFNIEASGKIVTDGSNYPKGGYRIDGKK
jgi:hypothetical protein